MVTRCISGNTHLANFNFFEGRVPESFPPLLRGDRRVELLLLDHKSLSFRLRHVYRAEVAPKSLELRRLDLREPPLRAELHGEGEFPRRHRSRPRLILGHRVLLQVAVPQTDKIVEVLDAVFFARTFSLAQFAPHGLAYLLVVPPFHCGGRPRPMIENLRCVSADERSC